MAKFADQFPVAHELRKRILARFRAEGIALPSPTQTIQLGGHEAHPPKPPDSGVRSS